MASRGSLNRVMLIGRLGADPELRMTPNGAAVTNFNLATNEAYKDKEGQQVETTDWHRIVTWNRLAEFANNYLKKGSLVYVEGRLKTRSYDDKEGVKKYITEVVVNEITMLGGKSSSSDSPSAEPAMEVAGSDNSTGDDLPF